MIKGVGKQIVLLNNPESEIFEQAIFILKTGSKVSHTNMVKECEKMINANIRVRSKNKNRWKISFFLLLAAFIALLAYCIIK